MHRFGLIPHNYEGIRHMNIQMRKYYCARKCDEWNMLYHFLLFVVIISAFVFSGLPCAENAWAIDRETMLLRIGTGGATGVYYPIGKLIAEGITKYYQSNNGDLSGAEKTDNKTAIISVAQYSAGSVDNVKNIISKDTEAGIVQADVAAHACNKEGIFKNVNNSEKLRAVACLYPEKFHIVVRKDANIKSVFGLSGKHISLDEAGSGTLEVMRIVLRYHNLTENDLNPVYLKPVFTREKVTKGELQGFVMMSGAPMEAVTNLIPAGITLVPITYEKAMQINQKNPYLVPGVIHENVYPGIPQTPTLEVYALLTVNSDLNDDFVFAVTKALFSETTLALLGNGHPQGKAIGLKSALKGISIPLHDGAKRFYIQNGIEIKETL